MREIKFRVWVEAPDAEKGMHYPKLISFGSGELSWATLQDDSVIKDNGWCTKREVMQYTGLLDKNGVEIYEGDVFQDEEDGDINWVEYDTRYAGFTTTDGKGSGWWNPKDLAENAVYSEVIGNIYENGDLLK